VLAPDRSTSAPSAACIATTTSRHLGTRVVARPRRALKPCRRAGIPTPEGSGGWTWWDGTAWAGHGGAEPTAEHSPGPSWHPDPWHDITRNDEVERFDVDSSHERPARRPPLVSLPQRDGQRVGGAGSAWVFAGIVGAEVIAVALAVVFWLVGLDRSNPVRYGSPK